MTLCCENYDRHKLLSDVCIVLSLQSCPLGEVNPTGAVALGWGAVSDLSLILDLSQKFKHGLWRLKSKLKLSQKKHLTRGVELLH